MTAKKPEFQLVFPENQKRDANLSTTDALTFDSLGDFIEERKRISRALEDGLSTELRVDYSDFSNHVFFDSAQQKFNIARDRILTRYPFNGTREEKDAFHLTGSGYDNYVFEQWPRYVGYAELNGTSQFISASDSDNTLLLGSSSLYVSAWIQPTISEENMILQKSMKRDNYISYSDDFESGWAAFNSFVSASSIDGPLGVSGSTLVEDATALAQHRFEIVTNGGFSVDNTYCASVWVKAANRNQVRLECRGFSNHASVKFDLGTATAYGVSGDNSAFIDTAIESFEDDWFRCSMRWVQANGTDAAAEFWINSLDDFGNASYNGNSEDALYVFGAQISRNPIINPPAYLSSSGSSNEERSGYELFLSGATDPHVKFEMFSGSTTVSVSASYVNFTSSFNNVAAIYDNDADLAYIYINRDLRASSSADLGSIDDPPFRLLIGSGTLQEHAITPVRVIDFFSGSIDEVRIAHTASGLFHQKNYNRPIHAGGEFVTGSAKEPDYLKLHYPFNEGVVGTASIDQNVIDYSKSGLHGKFLNYDSAVRVSGAVMLDDPGNPILYSYHSGVVAFTSSGEIEAILYDNNNNNMIYNMIPEQLLIEDDNADGLLQAFTLGMARFFDEMKLYIDQFDNLRITNYDSVDETPDLFLPMLQRYFGWKVTEHYGDANPLSFFFGENILSEGSTGISLLELRNQFWRRILNNLPYLYKTKGKRHNLDAFFNVLGINKANINLKEYGYLPGGSIQDDRIAKNKPAAFLGVGTGSFGVTSGSFVQMNGGYLITQTTGDDADFAVETLVQLPHVSASYSGTLATGSIWQLTNVGDNVHMSLYWVRNGLESDSGKLVLTGTSGLGTDTLFSSSDLEIFNGDFVNIAAGKRSDGFPYISVRAIEGCDITLSEDFTGSAVWNWGIGSTYNLAVGAGSGTFKQADAQGFFGEVRFWSRPLSGSELDDHALHFESVGIQDATEEPHPLLGHWALNEEIVTDSGGDIFGITDLSQNGVTATGSGFPVEENAYQRFVRDYNHLSPSIDLKWTENKVRVRNKTELTFDDVAHDTNEVSLEFNLVDALNEDISKIFSTFDVVNNLVGNPVNKYRDEYQDLESLSRVYFKRLGDSLNFTRFFDLFQWFDKKLSDSIKQLLPARVKFIGGEQVVESHFLERNRYGYKYPIFRTPKDPQEGEINWEPTLDGAKFTQIEGRIRSRDEGAPNILTDRLTYGFKDESFLLDMTDSGTHLLSAELEIGGATLEPSFVYKGGDATLTEWSGSSYGGPLEITTGAPPTLNAGAPFLNLADDSIFFSHSEASYTSVSTTEGDIGLDDIVLEIIAAGNSASFPITSMLLDKHAGNVGWAVQTTQNNELRMIMASGGLQGFNSGPIESDSFFHAMIFVDRNVASPNGLKFYINGEESGAGAGLNLYASSQLNDGIALGVGGDNAGATSRHGKLCYAAMWHSASLLSADTAAGRDAQLAIAKERFFKVCGVYAQKSGGWNPIPETYDQPGTPKFIELTNRLSPGAARYQNGIEVEPRRRYYKVGSRWPRVSHYRAYKTPLYSNVEDDGFDLEFPSVRGYYSEPESENLIPNSKDLATWNTVNVDVLPASTFYTQPDESSPEYGVKANALYASGTDVKFGIQTVVSNLVPGETYTFSCFMRDHSVRYVFLAIDDPTDTHFSQSFYVWSQSTGGSYGGRIIDRGIVGLGAHPDDVGGTRAWNRGWMTFTASAATEVTASIYVNFWSDNRPYTYAGVVANQLWNPQIEVYKGAVPTSPIQTTGSVASRGDSRLRLTGTRQDGGDAFLSPSGLRIVASASPIASGTTSEDYHVVTLSNDSALDSRVAVKVTPNAPVAWPAEDHITLTIVSGSNESVLTGSLPILVQNATSNHFNSGTYPWAPGGILSSSFVLSASVNSIAGAAAFSAIGSDYAQILGEWQNGGKALRSDDASGVSVPSSLNVLEIGGNNSGSQRLWGLVDKVSLAYQGSTVAVLPEDVVSTAGEVKPGIGKMTGDCYCTPKSAYADGQETTDKHSRIIPGLSRFDETLLLYENGNSGGLQRLNSLTVDSTGTLFVGVRSHMMDDSIIQFDPEGIALSAAVPIYNSSRTGSIVRIPTKFEDPERKPRIVRLISGSNWSEPAIHDFWVQPETDKLFAVGFAQGSVDSYYQHHGGNSLAQALILTSSDHGFTWHDVLSLGTGPQPSNEITADDMGLFGITGTINGTIIVCGMTNSGPGTSDGNWLIMTSSEGGHFDTWGIVDHFTHSFNGTNTAAHSIRIENDIIFALGNARSGTVGDYVTLRSSSDEGQSWKTAEGRNWGYIFKENFFRAKDGKYMMFAYNGDILTSSSPAAESGTWGVWKDYFDYPDQAFLYDWAGIPAGCCRFSFDPDDANGRDGEYFIFADVIWFPPDWDSDLSAYRVDLDIHPTNYPDPEPGVGINDWVRHGGPWVTASFQMWSQGGQPGVHYGQWHGNWVNADRGWTHFARVWNHPHSASTFYAFGTDRSSSFMEFVERPVVHQDVQFSRAKVSGDTVTDKNDANTGVNFKNEFARLISLRKDRDNE